MDIKQRISKFIFAGMFAVIAAGTVCAYAGDLCDTAFSFRFQWPGQILVSGEKPKQNTSPISVRISSGAGFYGHVIVAGNRDVTIGTPPYVAPGGGTVKIQGNGYELGYTKVALGAQGTAAGVSSGTWNPDAS